MGVWSREGRQLRARRQVRGGERLGPLPGRATAQRAPRPGTQLGSQLLQALASARFGQKSPSQNISACTCSCSALDAKVSARRFLGRCCRCACWGGVLSPAPTPTTPWACFLPAGPAPWPWPAASHRVRAARRAARSSSLSAAPRVACAAGGAAIRARPAGASAALMSTPISSRTWSTTSSASSS